MCALWSSVGKGLTSWLSFVVSNCIPLFRKPKNVEIPKRLGVRAVVVDYSNNFLLTLQDILNPDLSLMFGKMQVIK